MNLDHYRKILEMIPHPTEIRLFLSGEPLLHPNIDLYTMMALECGHSVLIHTNGLKLKECRLLEIGEVFPNRISIKVSIMDNTISPQLDNVIKFFSEQNTKLGNNIRFGIYHIGNINGKASAYEGVGFEARTPHNWIGTGKNKHEYKIPCGFLEDSVAIYWNGDVPVCCADLNGDTVIGNVFKDGWESTIESLNTLKRHQESRWFVKECMECERYGKNPDYKSAS